MPAPPAESRTLKLVARHWGEDWHFIVGADRFAGPAADALEDRLQRMARSKTNHARHIAGDDRFPFQPALCIRGTRSAAVFHLTDVRCALKRSASVGHPGTELADARHFDGAPRSLQ